MSIAKYALVAVIASAFLAGCSDDSSDDSNNGNNGNTGGAGNPNNSNLPKPCTLATIAQVQPIVDESIVDDKEFDYQGAPTCAWLDSDESEVLTLAILARASDFDVLKPEDTTKFISGLGEEAYVSGLSSIYVRTSKNAFWTQSLFPVKDGTVSAEIKAATASSSMNEQQQYESAYRLAKIVVGKL